MDKNENIRLSVLDIERKYIVDPDELTYGNNKLVTWGADNKLPMLYRNCYNQSASLKAIIDGTINYVLGDEVIVNESAAAWAEKVNRNGMTMRQFIAKLAFNYFVYGGFAIQVVYNRLGQVVELFPLDFGRCRTNENNSKIYYAKSWTKYQTKSEEFDAFNKDKIDMENPTQIFYFKGDFTASVYPLPPYAGGIYDVLTEVECSKYSLNTVARGFSAKYVFNFPETANLTDEQKQGIETSIRNKFCGSENETNFLLYWRNSPDDKGIEISKIESDETPERYIAIKDNARANIFVSMKATPLLFGLPNASNGFSTDEYKDSFKLYNKTVVEPVRDIILESFAKITGITDGITITDFTIDFTRDGE